MDKILKDVQKAIPYTDIIPYPNNTSPTANLSDHEALKQWVVEQSKRTAIGGNASPILQQLVKQEIITPTDRILDFGKGKGRNSNYLQNAGFSSVMTYDIAANSNLPPPSKYDVILLQYVLNVVLLESREEILAQIKSYCHSNTLILVEVRSENQIKRAHQKSLRKSKTNTKWTPLEDGLLTSKNTFQKGFKKSELQSFLQSQGFMIETVIKDDRDKCSLLCQVISTF